MGKFFITIALFLSGCASDNLMLNNQLIKQVNGKYTTQNGFIFENNSKIVVKFKNISPKIVDNFEKKYNLVLDEILIMGDYIYIHKNNDIIKLLNLISNEQNIKSAIPLWKKIAHEF